MRRHAEYLAAFIFLYKISSHVYLKHTFTFPPHKKSILLVDQYPSKGVETCSCHYHLKNEKGLCRETMAMMSSSRVPMPKQISFYHQQIENLQTPPKGETHIPPRLHFGNDPCPMTWLFSILKSSSQK